MHTFNLNFFFVFCFFCCLFGASFMSIACSEVKILKMKKECFMVTVPRYECLADSGAMLLHTYPLMQTVRYRGYSQ